MINHLDEKTASAMMEGNNVGTKSVVASNITTTRKINRIAGSVALMESRDDRATRVSSQSTDPNDGTGLSVNLDLNGSLCSTSSSAIHLQQLNSLSWRADPKTSFSDWTLEVVGMEGTVTKSVSLYHAHSNVIAWGPRKGGFFVHLFQERMCEIPPSTFSRIQVPPAEADVFPVMLDFMYCENSLPLSADKACILYAMGGKFVIPQLQTAIQRFVERYLSLGQMIEFIQYAREQTIYASKEIDKLVLCAVSKLCAYLVKHPKEAKEVEPSLLLYTLEQRAKVLKKLKAEDPQTYSGKWEAERSRLLSKVVAECCQMATMDVHKSPSGEYSTLSRSQFQQMMAHLPDLENHAALVLMQVDRKLASLTKPTQSYNNPHATSSFDDKCVEMMTAQWRKGILQKSEKENDRLIEFLQELSPKVLAKLLVRVSQQYEQDMNIAEGTAIAAAAGREVLSVPSRKSDVSTKVNINHLV
jgi:hypothetical protein